MFLKSRGILFAAFLAALFLPGHSVAQEKPESLFELGDVVVTAERREESAQETPMSVDVLSGENLEDKDPEPDFSMKADFLCGNYNKVRSRAMINAPLVEDKVFFRLSSLTSNRDGFMDVANRGTSVDNENLWALRGQMLVLPAENLEMLFKSDYSREKGSRGLGIKVNDNFSAPQILRGA